LGFPSIAPNFAFMQTLAPAAKDATPLTRAHVALGCRYPSDLRNAS
jgi:hypothetical protein